VDGVTITYDHGEFWVTAPGTFKTPLGNQGRHGFLIREVDPQTGADLDPAVDEAFGHILLTSAVALYKAVRDLPAEQRKEPPAPTG